MIYVVNTDIEVEAATPELAEDRVLSMLDELDNVNEDDMFAAVISVKELN